MVHVQKCNDVLLAVLMIVYCYLHFQTSKHNKFNNRMRCIPGIFAVVIFMGTNIHLLLLQKMLFMQNRQIDKRKLNSLITTWEMSWLSSTIRSQCLSLFGHKLVQMKQQMSTNYFLSPQRSFGEGPWLTVLSAAQAYITDDLTSFDTGLLKARDASQTWSFWRMLTLYTAMES